MENKKEYHKLALELNQKLSATFVADMLSDFGRGIYKPKGIISQSTEAKADAHRYNATIGMAYSHKKPLYLPIVREKMGMDLAVEQVFPYSPICGVAELRRQWQKHILENNPAVTAEQITLPVVTNGLTHAFFVAASLFCSPRMPVVIPDIYWGNYDLSMGNLFKSSPVTYPLFNKTNGLNLEGLKEALDNAQKEYGQAFVLLNFPQNPTGYTPTEEETREIAALLKKKGDDGLKMVVFHDDAYFGLFFEDNIYKHSLFNLTADLCDNILSIKGDAATKEELAWGFRVGFLTMASKGLENGQLNALVEKCAGVVRASVSSGNTAAQNVLLRSLTDSAREKQKDNVFHDLKNRYQALKKFLTENPPPQTFVPMPCNSGYFALFCYQGNAENLRRRLLNEEGIGVVALQQKYIRIAFSSVDASDIPDLMQRIYKCVQAG